MADLEVFLRGGLGNQLFQYAAGLFLAKRQGDQLIVRTDLLPLERDSIGQVSRWPVQITDFKFEGVLRSRTYQPQNGTHFLSKLLQVQRMMGDKSPKLLPSLGVLAGEKSASWDFLNMSRIKTINSYCSSSTPATELGDFLRAQILEVLEPSQSFQQLSEQAISDEPTMIHMRLGDYMLLKDLYGETKIEDLDEALGRRSASARRPVWLFSDSPDSIDPKVVERLGVDKVVGPETLQKPLETLILMSSGSDLFCANSTFSWWAAFLKSDRGSVFYPTPAQIPNVIFRDDIILPGWTPY